MGFFKKIKDKFTKKDSNLSDAVFKVKLALEIAVGKELFNTYSTQEQSDIIQSVSEIMLGARLDEFTVDNYELLYTGAVIALYGETGEVVELDQQHNNLIDAGFINKAMVAIKPKFYVDQA